MSQGPLNQIQAPTNVQSMPIAANLDSFAKAKGLVVMERVDHVAAN